MFISFNVVACIRIANETDAVPRGPYFIIRPACRPPPTFDPPCDPRSPFDRPKFY